MNTLRILASRVGDMHPNRTLALYQQRDGDLILVILQDGVIIKDTDICREEDAEASVQFCLSGGRSTHTRAALIELKRAIELDNAERPISSGP